ncbi:MAG: MOSC domain-containing protein [Candidatus Dormibacteria bacterium]
MEIAELWRYPVKSMAGERITRAEITSGGLPLDRGIAAFDRKGRRPDHPLSARHLPGLLLFAADVVGGEVMVSGPDLPPTPWREDLVRQRLGAVCRRPIELAEVEGGAFDDAPLHLIVLPSVAELAGELAREVDPRRFRANLLISAARQEGRSERRWVGSELASGQVVLRVAKECPRCVVTTRDPTTHQQWPQLLRHLAQTRDAMMGVYCEVVAAGQIAESDPLVLL